MSPRQITGALKQSARAFRKPLERVVRAVSHGVEHRFDKRCWHVAVNSATCRSRRPERSCSSIVSRAYERLSLIVTTNLPFEQWTEVMGSEPLTGALLDRLTHRVHIIEANGGPRIGDRQKMRK